MAPPQQRWKEAFARVRAIESTSPALSTARWPTAWTMHGPTALRSDAQTAGLPRYLRPVSGPTGRRRARAGADLIRIGKFDVDREVRLRAFYGASQRTVRFQAGGKRNGVERSLAANRHVAQYAPSLGPGILDEGMVKQSPYLVEQVVQGRHPANAMELQGTIEPITEQLSAVHAGFGISQRPVSDILGPRFPSRWREAVSSGLIDAGTDLAVRRLLDRQGTVPVSLGHGDLVGTNILIRAEGITLIDWEYAGPLPVLFDVAKLHLHSADADVALTALQHGLRPSLRQGTTDYSAREQVALGHVRYLAWGAIRWQRAEAANRLDQLRKVTNLRLRAVRDLLEVS